MTESKVLTLRLDPKVDQPTRQVSRCHPTQPFLRLPKRCGNTFALNEWQIQETKKALKEADRGEFASDEEVKKTFQKRSRRAG